jgi:hypothetical protein
MSMAERPRGRSPPIAASRCRPMRMANRPGWPEMWSFVRGGWSLIEGAARRHDHAGNVAGEAAHENAQRHRQLCHGRTPD